MIIKKGILKTVAFLLCSALINIYSFSNLCVFKVVEISKGSKVKYELDKKTGLIKVWG